MPQYSVLTSERTQSWHCILKSLLSWCNIHLWKCLNLAHSYRLFQCFHCIFLKSEPLASLTHVWGQLLSERLHRWEQRDVKFKFIGKHVPNAQVFHLSALLCGPYYVPLHSFVWLCRISSREMQTDKINATIKLKKWTLLTFKKVDF